MHELATGRLRVRAWVGEGVAVSSLRYDGVELLDRPGPHDVFGRDDVPLAIALLYPWANRLAADSFPLGPRRASAGAAALRDRAGLAIHGFTGRDPGWNVTEATPCRLAAERRWDRHGPHWKAFPVAHRTCVTIQTREDALVLDTTVVAEEDVPVPVAFGWHPYLAPPDGPRARWTLGLPPARQLALGDDAWDDAFAVGPRAHASLCSREWRLTIELDAGYPFLQVYAPANRDVACIEPMTAPTNALLSHDALPYACPGAPFHARFTLRVERRADAAGGRLRA
jgi:aldose 1-epimerase